MALWRPFEVEFGSFQADLDRQSEEVKDEILLASNQAAASERELQIVERTKHARYRKDGNLKRLEEQRWRSEVDWRKTCKLKSLKTFRVTIIEFQ